MLGGVDVVVGQDLARGEVDDGDLGVVGDGEDSGAAVGVADAEVMHLAGPAEADLAPVVDVVVAQPVVPGRLVLVDWWMGFRAGGVGLGRGGAVEGPVGSLFVVDRAESVELGLEFVQGGRCWLAGEPAFLGLVESFDLALGLGVARCAVLLGDAERGQGVFEGVLPATEAGCVDRGRCR